MKRNEISEHEVRFYLALRRDEGKWQTSRELAVSAKIAYRTARAFAKKLSDLGLIEVAEVFPGHRYRFGSEFARKRNSDYIKRLYGAAEVFGIPWDG